MGKDPASVEVAKEVEKRQKQMAKKRALYQEVSSRKTAWGSAQENLKKAQTQFSKVKKAVGNKKGPEAWELMQKANAALEKAEKQELKARDRYFSSAKRARASERVAKGEAGRKRDHKSGAETKWEQRRKETYDSLKGMSKKEVLAKLNQNMRIHALTEKDTMSDLKSAVVSSIHGNTHPGQPSPRVQAALRKGARKEGEVPK
jgi:hypothetical protein